MDSAYVAHSSPIKVGCRLLTLLSLDRIAVSVTSIESGGTELIPQPEEVGF